MRYKQQSTKEPFPGSSALINLLPLLQLATPTFPSLTNCVRESTSIERPKKRKGLFSELIGDPQIIFQDLLLNPNKYEEGVSELIQDLVSKRKTLERLDEREMQMLDRAVIDYNSPNRRPEQQLRAPEKPKEKEEPDEEEIEDNKPIPLIDGLRPYWWLG